MKKTAAPNKAKTAFNPQDYVRSGVQLQDVLEIKEAFDLFDNENTGSIDSHELKTSLVSFGYQAKNETLLRALACLSPGDMDKPVTIDFSKFFELLTAYSSPKKDRWSLQRVFNLFDDERTGFISIKNLRRVVKEVGQNIDDSQMQEMIERADLDNDGLISSEQFYAIMNRRSNKS